MKFLFVSSLILALVAASVAPIPPEYCDFQCAPAQRSACGTNGQRYRRFPGICELDKHNCLNPHRGLQKVADRKCGEKQPSLTAKSGDY